MVLQWNNAADKTVNLFSLDACEKVQESFEISSKGLEELITQVTKDSF